MLRRLKAAVTARSAVLALLVLLAASMAAAALVPHLFTTPWFAALTALFLLALALSTLDQLRLALARTRRLPAWDDGERPSPLPAAQVEALLRGEGYRRLAAAGGRSRHVRHWQGYWGNVLLHAGITVTVLFGVTYLLTEHRTTLLVEAGRPAVLAPGRPPARRGPLAGEVELPAEVRLYRVEPTFGANDQLVDLASTLVFTDRQGGSREVRVAVNDHRDDRGVTVYQLLRYGHAFLLEARDGAGAPVEHLVRLPFPAGRGAPSYADQPLGGGRLLRAKYYASADHRELLSDDPQLVLRLQEGARVLGEATLQAGQEARLGPWAVRLVRAGWWTELLFEGSRGVGGIFAGFFLLVAGAGLVFFLAPREVVLRATPEGCTVHWRCTRFPEMYRLEGERLLARCTREEGGA